MSTRRAISGYFRPLALARAHALGVRFVRFGAGPRTLSSEFPKIEQTVTVERGVV
jgi:hypothetical protein